MPSDDSTHPIPNTLISASFSDSEAHSQDESAAVLPTVEEKTVISGIALPPAVGLLRPQSIAEQASVLRGNQLGQYVLDELIGGGGMGAVFRGHDTLLDRTVAVKVVPSSRPDADTLRRFHAEAQSAAKLDHPNIARVYNFGESEDWKYIVFEFVEGVNLRDWVNIHGPLAVDDAVFFVRQVAEALDHASSRSIVHRDIKPSNIIVGPDGQIKVVDMGLARTIALESSHDITASGVTLGTFDYVSPEQARDPRNADVRSDLYSLGCTFYFLLTGSPPFADGTAVQKVFMHTSENPPDPRAYRDDLSPDLVAILFKLMAKKPSDRYQTPRDLVGDLQLLAEIEQLPKCRSNLPTLPVVAQWSKKTPWELTRPWLITILAGAAVTAFLYFEPAWKNNYPLPALASTGSYPSRVADDTLLDLETAAAATATNPPSLESTDRESSSRPINSELAAEPSAKQMLNASGSPLVAKTEPNQESGEGLSQRPANAESVQLDRSGVTVYIDPRIDVQLNRDGVPTASDLPAAIEYAVQHPEVRDIVILADELRISPIELPQHRLRVTAATGYRPKLRVVADATVDRQSSVIQIGSSEIDFHGIDFEWTQNADSNWESLFSVQEGTQVRFEQCSFRIAHAAIQKRPAVIGLTLTGNGTGGGASDPLRLRFENSVVRGPCDILRMVETRRSEVTMRNVLIAIDGSLLELGGLSVKSRSSPTVRVQMDRVTSISGGPFAILSYSEARKFPANLVRHANNSVFWCGNDSAYVRIDGLPNDLDFRKMVELRGSDNAYDETIQDWMEVTNAEGMFVRLPFETLAEMNPLESGVEGYVRWISPLPRRPDYLNQPIATFRQRLGDYQPGFDESFLPK